MENPHYEASLSYATPKEAYEYNHGEIVEVMGHLQATIASNYRNERPRNPEHIGKQEELLAMLHSVLELARA
jgi:hypothetical protein